MTVVSVHKDVEAMTLTLVAEFAAERGAGVAGVGGPAPLERWWGPPGWPATFERHEFVVGGQSRYHMTGPDGQKSRGWWTITAIEAPHRLEFDDGFAGEDGEPLASPPPVHGIVTLEALGNRYPHDDGQQIRRHRPPRTGPGHGGRGGHAPGAGPDRRDPRRHRR